VSSNRRIIYDSNNVRVVLDEKDSETVFVTFNTMSFVCDGDHYWGEKFLEPFQVTVVGFVTPRPNWYPPADMAHAIPAAVSAIRGRRVVTYGHSQGGFGALKYSNALSASVALSFCPLWSIDPKLVASFDKRTAEYFNPALGNGHRIEKDDLCAKSILFFDPRDSADGGNARKICENTAAERVLAPFCGHSVIVMAAESRIAQKLIERGQSPDCTATELRNIVRSGRRNSATYQREKLRMLMKRIKRGTLFLERHLATYPDGAFKTIIGATITFRRGKRAAAVETLNSVPTEEWLKLDLFAFWLIFNETNFAEGELIVSPLLKLKYPTDCLICLHAVNAHIRHKKFAEAFSDMEFLVQLPGAAKQAHVLAGFYKTLGRPELAEQLLARFGLQVSA
jgi:hypothetical protein